jgi:hypothetical protein
MADAPRRRLPRELPIDSPEPCPAPARISSTSSILLFGYSLVRLDNMSPRLARAAHLSIAWVMVNWWAHDSLHLHNGMDLSGLLKIEDAFHSTLMAAGLTLARFLLPVTRRPAVVTSAL